MKPSARVTVCLVTAFAAAAIAAGCSGGGGGGGYGGPPGPQPSPPSILGIHMILFSGNAGVYTDATFGAVTGYTQQQRSQVLGLPPNTQIVITNNDTVSHTVNVYSGGYSASPSLGASGGNVLVDGYRSGSIVPGGSVNVTTGPPGTYYIECALHYLSDGMKDGMILQVGASPGPQATPDPTKTCSGYGC